MADPNDDPRFLSVSKKNALNREIDKTDQSFSHVRSVCAIVKDAVDRDIDSIQDFLQELLPPDMLFDTECQINNRVFFTVRRLLEDIGVVQAMDRSRERISIKVARALFTNDDEREEAEDRIKEFVASKQTRMTSGTDVARNGANATRLQTSDNHSLPRNKAAVASAFKEEDKFTGSVSGKVPLHRVRNRFLDAVRDQAIPRQEEVSILHCCLSGMALDFYYKQIRDISMSKENAFSLLEKQFNSLQHQAQARTYINSMDIDTIKKEKSCSTLEALEIAHSRINDTVPNCGREYQQESHYCDFLERIVQHQPWAHQVIQNRLTPSSNEVMEYNTF